MNKIAVPILMSLSFLLGQWTTYIAVHPERLRDSAYILAGQAYKLGCKVADGKSCAVRAFEFEEMLRKEIPIEGLE